MQMVCLWKEGKDCKQKWTVTVPRCRPNKFWCQDYHQQQQQKLTTAGIWTNGKLNYSFDAEFGSLFCSDFWGLMTPLCLFLTKNWWWELQIVLQMEWNNLGLLLMCSSWLVRWLMFRALLVEKPNCTFQCMRDRIRGLDSHQSLLWLMIFASTRNLKCRLYECSSVTRRM